MAVANSELEERDHLLVEIQAAKEEGRSGTRLNRIDNWAFDGSPQDGITNAVSRLWDLLRVGYAAAVRSSLIETSP